jgi:hypothetical protein
MSTTLGYMAGDLPAFSNTPNDYTAAALKYKNSGAPDNQFLATLVKNMAGGQGVPTEDWQQQGGLAGNFLKQKMSPDGLTPYQRTAAPVKAEAVMPMAAPMMTGAASSIPAAGAATAAGGAGAAGGAAGAAGGAGLLASV